MPKLGVLGGGQLGRMLIQAAIDLDVTVSVLDESGPCEHIAHHFVRGDPKCADAVEEFGADLDVLTIEVENVSAEGMRRLQARGVRVVPSPDHVALIQDKGLQKQFFEAHDIPTADFVLSSDPSAMGYPVVQKLRVGGYDGKGVRVLTSAEGAFDGQCLLEKKVDVAAELSVIVARTPKEVTVYPATEQVFDERANVALYVLTPPRPDVQERAVALALRVADALDFVGLLAVELFLSTNGDLLVNELAPRPHNSGHHTIEANATSQYAQLLRVCLDFPLGDIRPVWRAAAVLNILGDRNVKKGSKPKYVGIREALDRPQVYPHIYGKSTVSPRRKMGHVTIVGDDTAYVIATIDHLLCYIGVEAEEEESQT